MIEWLFPDDIIVWYIFLIIFGVSFVLGTILHEFGHKIFCELTGVKIIGVSYFNFDEDIEADGFVVHENPETFTQALLITIGPLFTVGFVLFLIILLLINNLEWLSSDFFIMSLLMGFGLSMFPSTHDVNNLIEFVKKKYKFSSKQSFLQNGKTILIWLFMPIIYILKLCSYFYVKFILFIILFIVFFA